MYIVKNYLRNLLYGCFCCCCCKLESNSDGGGGRGSMVRVGRLEGGVVVGGGGFKLLLGLI